MKQFRKNCILVRNLIVIRLKWRIPTTLGLSRFCVFSIIIYFWIEVKNNLSLQYYLFDEMLKSWVRGFKLTQVIIWSIQKIRYFSRWDKSPRCRKFKWCNLNNYKFSLNVFANIFHHMNFTEKYKLNFSLFSREKIFRKWTYF